MVYITSKALEAALPPAQGGSFETAAPSSPSIHSTTSTNRIPVKRGAPASSGTAQGRPAQRAKTQPDDEEVVIAFTVTLKRPPGSTPKDMQIIGATEIDSAGGIIPMELSPITDRKSAPNDGNLKHSDRKSAPNDGEENCASIPYPDIDPDPKKTTAERISELCTDKDLSDIQSHYQTLADSAQDINITCKEQKETALNLWKHLLPSRIGHRIRRFLAQKSDVEAFRQEKRLSNKLHLLLASINPETDEMCDRTSGKPNEEQTRSCEPSDNSVTEDRLTILATNAVSLAAPTERNNAVTFHHLGIRDPQGNPADGIGPTSQKIANPISEDLNKRTSFDTNFNSQFNPRRLSDSFNLTPSSNPKPQVPGFHSIERPGSDTDCAIEVDSIMEFGETPPMPQKVQSDYSMTGDQLLEPSNDIEHPRTSTTIAARIQDSVTDDDGSTRKSSVAAHLRDTNLPQPIIAWNTTSFTAYQPIAENKALLPTVVVKPAVTATAEKSAYTGDGSGSESSSSTDSLFSPISSEDDEDAASDAAFLEHMELEPSDNLTRASASPALSFILEDLGEIFTSKPGSPISKFSTIPSSPTCPAEKRQLTFKRKAFERNPEEFSIAVLDELMRDAKVATPAGIYKDQSSQEVIDLTKAIHTPTRNKGSLDLYDESSLRTMSPSGTYTYRQSLTGELSINQTSATLESFQDEFTKVAIRVVENNTLLLPSKSQVIAFIGELYQNLYSHNGYESANDQIRREEGYTLKVFLQYNFYEVLRHYHPVAESLVKANRERVHLSDFESMAEESMEIRIIASILFILQVVRAHDLQLLSHKVGPRSPMHDQDLTSGNFLAQLRLSEWITTTKAIMFDDQDISEIILLLLPLHTMPQPWRASI